MRNLRSRRLAVAASLVGALLATGMAACSSDGQPAQSLKQGQAAGPASGERALAGEGATGNAKAGNPDGGSAGETAAAAVPPRQQESEVAKAPSETAATGRSIIYSGTMTRRVGDVDTAAAEATAITSGAGGFVGGDQRTADARQSRATLTLRVPSTRFAAVLDSLRNLGTEESRDVSTQDVTEQVADLNSRVATARASVDRVRQLLARAQTIAEIVSLESELSRREADLESLQARLRKLDDLTALSTITLILLGPDAKAKPKRATRDSDSGFLSGLHSGWDAFTSSLVVLLTILGVLLPWLVALAIPLGGVIFWRRRRNRRPEPQSSSTG